MSREATYGEEQAAAMLRPAVSYRTLKRWRVAGKVPHVRTPGGRIFYTFEQLVEIGTTMRACPRVSPRVPESPYMSGENAVTAE